MENNKIISIKKMVIAAMLSALSVYGGLFFVTAIIITAFMSYCFFETSKFQKIFTAVLFTAEYLLIDYFALKHTDIINSIILDLNILLPAIVTAILFEKKINNLRTLVHTLTFTNIFISILELAKSKFIDKIDFTDEYIKPSLDLIRKNADQLKNVSQEYSINFEHYMNIFQRYIVIFTPIMLIISSMTVSFFTVKLAVYFINKINKKNGTTVFVTPFDLLEAPRYTGLVLLFALIVSLTNDYNTFVGACYNMVAVILFEYAICGVAIILHYLKIKLNLKGLYKIIIYTIALFFITMLSTALSFVGGLNILIILGMFDSSFNIRKIHKTER